MRLGNADMSFGQCRHVIWSVCGQMFSCLVGTGALILAVIGKNQRVVELLLAAKADVNIRDYNVSDLEQKSCAECD